MRHRHYQMGDTERAIAANAPITLSQAQAGKAELGAMRKSLEKWLRYRTMNDTIASGQGASLPTPFFRAPGSKLPTPAVMSLRLSRERYATESELALQLYQLLSEVHDPQGLPNPDVDKNPRAAVELAQIAIAGKLPTEASSPNATGFVWLWPVVIVVGAIALVLMTAIKSSADRAAEHEHYECVKAGKCTDSGFWMKVGAVAFIGWLAWDKFGVGKALTRKAR